MYGYWGLGKWGYPAVRGIEEEKKVQKMNSIEHAHDNSHLRSTHEVTGYDIHATDGDIGAVNDFIIDDTIWEINSLIVETGNSFSGKKVLFSPDRIKEINWKTGAVIIDTTIAHVKSSPKYDPEAELTNI